MLLSAALGIIRLAVVVFFKVSFQPLTKLEVVLVLGIFELVNIDVSLDSIFVKGRLQNFVVLNKFILVLSVPLNFAEWEGVWV